ncbi:glycosyltransferase, partial [Candidatus Bathyarchaeota archaeon]|nr:glycosyltransferase [Candidatus Bathyarchaeota archaeon]
MDSLKLCLISSEFFPVWGGVGAYTLNLVRHLPEAINIHVVTMHRKIKKSTKEPTTTIAERNHEFPFHRKNLHLHFLCSTAETFFNYLKFQLLCAKEIKKLNKQYQFDIIHTQFPIMPDIFTNLFRRLRTPFVCTVHSTVETQFRSIRMDMNF